MYQHILLVYTCNNWLCQCSLCLTTESREGGLPNCNSIFWEMPVAKPFQHLLAVNKRHLDHSAITVFKMPNILRSAFPVLEKSAWPGAIRVIRLLRYHILEQSGVGAVQGVALSLHSPESVRCSHKVPPCLSNEAINPVKAESGTLIILSLANF